MSEMISTFLSPVLQSFQGISDIHINIRKIIHMNPNVRDARAIYIQIRTFNINFLYANESE